MTDPILDTPDKKRPSRKPALSADQSGAREATSASEEDFEQDPPRLSLVLGHVVAGKYRLERLLKRGGMGSVWAATHLGLQSPVAIKFMASRVGDDVPGTGDESTRARFEREASAAAKLRMANIVQVLDYGLDDGVPYLVMELLEGEDLGARLARVGRMPVAEAAAILSAISRALQRAHDMGLVHRDLKPENIFLAKEGDEEIPKILDFGVAKAITGDDKRAGDSTSEGTVVGTPFYISPEQAVGRTDIDHRSDLWSLAVIAYRMITGEKPFKSELLLEVIVEICSGEICKPTSIARDLPPEVDRFFDKALAREAEERFQSARELVAAFNELTDLEEVARRRAMRRTRITLVALLVICAIALTAFLTMEFGGKRSRNEPLPSATAVSGQEALPPPPTEPTASATSAILEAPTASATESGSLPAPSASEAPSNKPHSGQNAPVPTGSAHGTGASTKSAVKPNPTSTKTSTKREVGY